MAPFLFEPYTLRFTEYCKLLYYEGISHSERDMYLVKKVIDELVHSGILRSNPVQHYYYYEFDNITVHDVYLTTSDNAIFSHGTSLDISEAYAKALGEVFERTSLRYNPDTRTIVSDERGLKKKNIAHVSLSVFPQATMTQKELYPKMSYDDTAEFSWTPVESLGSSDEIFVPSQCVFLSNFRSYHDEAIIIESSSHGAGAGYTKDQAVESGIFEITNRHFFLSSWYKHEIPRRIDLDTIPKDEELSALISDFKARGFNIHFLDYSSEAGIPSVICIIERYGGWSCGGTAALTLKKALTRSLLEALSTYLWYVERSHEGVNRFTDRDIVEVRDAFVEKKYGDPFNRTMLYQYEMFVHGKELSKSMITGPHVSYTEENDKQNDYNIVAHAKNLFGEIYVYYPEKEYCNQYKYSSAKIIIPQTYFFSLNETGSRPVLNGTYPQNTEMNPFP